MLIIAGWFGYQKATDDTYEGMSIIPEQHKDIPLFKGLKPGRNEYSMKGNHWEDIYTYYMQVLPTLGWEVQHEESAFNDQDEENNPGGFYSRWRKEGFNGELWIFGSYNPYDKITEVVFDKNPILTSTSWIEDLPDTICLYETPTAEKCTEINDAAKIKGIASLINTAIDYEKEQIPAMKNTSIIDFRNLKITVYYDLENGIYFESDKGIKSMKPEGEFFEWTDLAP